MVLNPLENTPTTMLQGAQGTETFSGPPIRAVSPRRRREHSLGKFYPTEPGAELYCGEES